MEASVQVELIKQVGELLKTLVWLAAAALIVFCFRRELASFASRIIQLNLKTPAGEISATAAAQASALLGVAQTSKEDGEVATVEEKTAAVAAVGETVKAATAAGSRLRSRKILWVDDNPSNNQFEIQAFQALGLNIDTATTTEDGLRKLSREIYDLAITDLTRGTDTKAGLKFIEAARAKHKNLKIVVYASRRGEVQFPRAYELGAMGATYRPTELVDRVVELLG